VAQIPVLTFKGFKLNRKIPDPFLKSAVIVDDSISLPLFNSRCGKHEILSICLSSTSARFIAADREFVVLYEGVSAVEWCRIENGTVVDSFSRIFEALAAERTEGLTDRKVELNGIKIVTGEQEFLLQTGPPDLDGNDLLGFFSFILQLNGAVRRATERSKL
jgi:hypothetical protein